MKYKVVARTFDEVPEENMSEITLDTNSLNRVEAFIRERIRTFRENDCCAGDGVERIVYIEKDDCVTAFYKDNWDVEAEKWLRKYDWF